MIATACIAASLACATAQPTLEYVGLLPLPGEALSREGSIPIRGLSGIAYAGDDRWMAVCDRGGVVCEFRIHTSEHGGHTIGSEVWGERLPEAGDYEGIAIARAGCVLIADESSGTVIEFDLESRERATEMKVGRAEGAHGNLGLESLTRTPGGSLWVATERATRGDEPDASRTGESRVRLVHLTDEGRPFEEYVYVVDAAHAPALGGRGVSGLSELLYVGEGRLLALERAFVVGPDPFRSRIYLIDTTGATDTRAIASLEDGAFTPVEKLLLWEGAAGNLEGMAIGPRLEDGSRLLLGVVDDGDPLSQNAVVTFHFRD